MLLKEHKRLLPILLAGICLLTASCSNDTSDESRQISETAETVPQETTTSADESLPGESAEPVKTEESAVMAAESAADEGTLHESTLNETEDAVTSKEAEQLAIPEIQLKLPWGANTTDYRPAEYRFIDTDGRELSIEGTIKVRGNSTAGGLKKPFNIKLDRKVSLFGMERGKRWVLLANMFDKTALRNMMALNFAETLNLEYTTDCMFVDVYLNDNYQGMYLLCEDISVSEDRVDIDPENGDWLLEYESVRANSKYSFVTNITGMRFKVKEPETPTKNQLTALKEFLIQCDLAATSKDYEKISAYFDVASFADYYLFSEIYKDVDGKFSSLFFYIRDNKVYAGPVWDYDLSCGNASIIYKEDKYQSYHNVPGYEGTGSSDSADGIWMQFGWFKYLMQCEEFSNLVTERYKELYPLIKNQFLDNELGQNQIDRLREEYSESIQKNMELWDISKEASLYEWHPMFDNYEDYIIFYRNWFIRRITFLNETFGVEDELPAESEYTAQ